MDPKHLLLLFFLLSAVEAIQSPPPILLPLTRSFPKSSRPINSHRRQLHVDKDPAIARMRLYDDLLTNGYYTTRLFIGTPPQEFALIVDSGSTVTYVPCSTCQKCGIHQDPRFQPDLSSTYEPVKCKTDCSCNKDNTQCTYERKYAEMSSSSGVLGEDVISFGNESSLTLQRATFGCENSETGDLFTQHADGIIGLGRGPLSIMDQLVEKGVISDSFSLCYGGMDIGGGAMVLGGIPTPPGMVFSHSDPGRSPYYNIVLKEIHVDGDPLQLDSTIFDGKYGTVLDSGTTYAYLPQQAFIAFRNTIISKLKSLKQIRGPDPNYNDLCFSGAGSDVSELSKTFPQVDMVFDNGETLSLSPENYLFRHSKVQGAYCLGIFQNGRDPTTLLGGIVVRNTLVTYDRQKERIGFWKTNCSKLWEELHMGDAPSSAPSISNSSIIEPPAPSPSSLQDTIFRGQFQIGLITFEMSLNITYSDLVPLMKELSEFIAHELEVDANQVRALNITTNGNGTLVRWAVVPEGSNSHFNSTTAMSIISRLNEHRFHLPDNFGTYKLLEWNVEPPTTRSWWRQHFVALFVGLFLTAILVFSAIMLWFFWRHGIEGLGTYRPVDAAIPEQELQPL